MKTKTPRVAPRPRRKRLVNRKTSAAPSAFVALLQADRWLFAASEALHAYSREAERSAINDIRRQVCEQLEFLQPCAYSAFDSDDAPIR